MYNPKHQTILEFLDLTSENSAQFAPMMIGLNPGPRARTVKPVKICAYTTNNTIEGTPAEHTSDHGKQTNSNTKE